jgi:hypothetical protein
MLLFDDLKITSLLKMGFQHRNRSPCDNIKPMADFKTRPGTFLPFLEASQQNKILNPYRDSPLTLLDILARQAQQSLPMFDLQTLSGLDPSRYAGALKSLKDAGYIAIDGEAPEQAIRLTGSGAQVVRLARPA